MELMVTISYQQLGLFSTKEGQYIGHNWLEIYLVGQIKWRKG
jgi:hypothetical protein